MDWVALAVGIVMILVGAGLVLARFAGSALRFSIMSPPTLRGWGYWEKLVPNERVASGLGQMFVFVLGIVLILFGAVAVIGVLLGLGS